MKKGHRFNAILTAEELKEAIKTNSNTTLYCKGYITVTEKIEKEMKDKNIKLGNA